MFSVRKVIKQFKADFVQEPEATPSTSSLRSDTSSSRTPSEDVSRYSSASLTRSLQNTGNREELLPIISVQHTESSNVNEAVSPLQKRSLIQSIQHNVSLIRPNETSPSIEGGPSRQDQPKPLSNWTPINPNPNPMNKEHSRIALSNSLEKRTSSSSNSSVPSIDILPPATPLKQPLFESLQQHSFINKSLPPDPGLKGVEAESAPLTSQWEESKGVHNDGMYEFELPESREKPKSPVVFSMPSNTSSKTTDGDAVLIERAFRETVSMRKRSKSPVGFSIPPNISSSKLTDGEAALTERTFETLSTRKRSKSPVGFSMPSNISSSEKTDGDATLIVRAFRETLSPEWEPEERPESPVDFSIPSNASSITEGDAALMAKAFREALSRPLSNSEAFDGPMESNQPSVIQTSQQLRELPYEDSVIQTTTPTAINGDDDNNKHTLETMERPDPTPTTQSLPLNSNNLSPRPNHPLFKRGSSVSIPGDFPLDGPSTPQRPPVESATKTAPDSDTISPKDNIANNRVETRRKPSSNSLNPFLLALASPSAAPTVNSTRVSEMVEETRTPWKPKPFRSLQPIGESSDSMSAKSSSSLSADDTLARKMEELGRLRRMESRNHLTQSKASHEVTTQRPSLSVRTTATPKVELRPHSHQEDGSSDIAALLREAYVERQQELQTQLDKALAELRDVRADNKRLTNENQTQHRSITQLKISLDEAKNAQGTSSVQIKNQLRDATASLAVLNKEKKGWQDKLDSMQHKLSVAERQVRCLDHLTRHKLESRHETAYGLPKRRGLLASVPASTDIIAAMNALNEEIFQTCVQLVDCLERTSTHSSSHKSLAQTMLGSQLTSMLEDQATVKTTSDLNMLLMQAVLEVFMVYWCSSIIEAFYPSQQSFADLLVELSAQTARNSGASAICGKQIRIVQPSTAHTDSVKFSEWVTRIIRELGFILLIAGLRMKVQRTHPFTALVKAAYNLRTAMAEKDICGGLEVVIVAPDTPFQEKWMTDAHVDPRKGDTDSSHVDFVAGTSAIGLQRQVSEKVDGHIEPKMVVVLKPKVILTRTLKGI